MAPNKSFGQLHLGQKANCNLMKSLEPELPMQFIPKFLTQITCELYEMLTVVLNHDVLSVICYIAIVTDIPRKTFLIYLVILISICV